MIINKDIRTLLDKTFGKGALAGDGINYFTCCPICKKTNKNNRKLIIRLDDLRYNCWVCDLKGRNITYLIKKYRPDLIEANDDNHFSYKKVVVEEEEEKIRLPKDFIFLGKNTRDPDINATKKYLRNRGLKKIDVHRWRMLATTSGSFRRKVIVPSFDEDGELNYYVARAIDKTPYRYKNAKVSKKKIIFNEVDINWKEPVLLVEGVFDAINCPENTIPILGSNLSKDSRIFQQILKYQPDVTVALDPDLKMKAFKIARLLKSTGCSVNITFAPEGKDFGDMTKKDILGVLSKSEPYEDFSRITHKIKSIRSGTIL